MNAYLFTGGFTRTQVRPTSVRGVTAYRPQTWDGCTNAILYGGPVESAQKLFESWLLAVPEGQPPADTEINKIIVAQFVDALLTESGQTGLDWPKVCEQINESLIDTQVDDFEQGYWAVVDEVVPPDGLKNSIESLQSATPEDIATGLNWSAEKQFYFVLSVLSPLPSPSAAGESEVQPPVMEGSGDLEPTLLQLRDQEAAALIQARNSVVAAWLWRRFAADTRLVRNAIRIEPWMGATEVPSAV